MKICLLADIHFGVRGNSVEFHNYFNRFYHNTFFPYLLENNITTVIQFGDVFDSRKQINLQTLHLAKQYFFNKLQEYNIQLHIILGNHCTFFKNSLSINSPELLLNEYSNVTIHNTFSTLDFDGTTIDLVPWLCSENESALLTAISQSKSPICCGHFEFSNFNMDSNSVCATGLDHKKLARYDQVFSGHFHTKSTKDNVLYLGTPVELTWSDYNDSKGFHIFDTTTRDLLFIQNPYRMFMKFTYDDLEQDFSYYEGFDFSKYQNCYVKVMVINKTVPYLFDKVLDQLTAAGPLDVSIIENLAGFVDEEDTVDESKNTIELLHEFIDNQELTVDSDKLKNIMQEIYMEALTMEKTS